MTDFISQISKEYFNKLINNTNSTTLISELSRFWAYRIEENKPQFNLSLTEYHCQLCLIYSGYVINGGHAQYFETQGTYLVADTKKALKRATDNSFVEIYNTSVEIANSFGICKWINPSEITNEKYDSWDICDQLFYKIVSNFDEKLKTYLRSNLEDILVQERS